MLGYWSERVRSKDGPAVRTEKDAGGATQAESTSSEQGKLKTSRKRGRPEIKQTHSVNSQPSRVAISLLMVPPYHFSLAR